MDYDEVVRKYLKELIFRHKFEDKVIEAYGKRPKKNMSFRALPPEEFRLPSKEYAIAKGKEVIMECEFLGCKGHVFTAAPYSGRMSVSEMVDLDLRSLKDRSMFFCGLNAIMRYLGLIDKTLHCKGDSPIKCGNELVNKILSSFGDVSVLLIGYQPAMAKALQINLRRTYITDMNPENIGKKVGKSVIYDHSHNYKILEDVDVVIITGSSVINSTLWPLIDRVKEFGIRSVIYGVSAAGAIKIIGLERFCPFGT